MADDQQHDRPLTEFWKFEETEQQRVERVRVAERKAAAAVTTETLKRRYGVE
jgi:hypothetical protein